MRYEAGERFFYPANLQEGDLQEAHFQGANLQGKRLEDLNFQKANLQGANLSRANLCRAALNHSSLHGADLRGALLLGIGLWDANLQGANLQGADLRYARLQRANFQDADLSSAQLQSANLQGANLRGAKFLGTNLEDANLQGADLRGADLRHARLHGTLLLNVDLTALCTADPPAGHSGPSYVDHKAILRSLRAPNLKEFLTRTGMPEVFVEYMVDCALSLKTDVFKMLQSTFISYGAPDERFARKLYEALHRNGVTTFFFPEHAEPGEKLHRMMREGVNEHDRVILICSKDSLDRKGVLNELEEILTREARDGGASYLIPIRLDDYVFTGWKPKNADVAQAVRDRVVADFEGANEDEAKFQAGLQKLIRALRKKTIEPGDIENG
ncbi:MULTISPECIES: toll/interleukin-1 receptor domain-containing protein [Sorangium]|uniref:toll/interleukin-1 receptor domain-containing protein n=1 Tax=Sorangium TaxID=39643 RepID=UPI0013EBC870|nr:MULTISPECIES: toll/interleukin-1 receptor domain-containing protein [Sorangium]